jgi:hypothetical protein
LTVIESIPTPHHRVKSVGANIGTRRKGCQSHVQ